MEYLLYSGDDTAIRKFSFTAQRGCISLPPEIVTPLKVRIDCKVAEVWSKWYTFASGSDLTGDCLCGQELMMQEGITTPLVYDLPKGGSLVGVMATCQEAEDAFVIFQGKDATGREVYTTWQGEQVVGVRLSLKKGQISYGNVSLAEITAVSKSPTVGYVSAWAVNPINNRRSFLADWAPSETNPSYQRMRILHRECPPLAQISMLARIRPKDSYSDNEITFFDNSLAVMIAAQRVQSEVNNDAQQASYKKGAVEDLLEKEAGYNKPPGRPVDVYHPLSGGAIRNILGGRSGRWGLW